MTDHSTPSHQPVFWQEPDGPRLPRIALMGEFSAGKSTLANLMVGKNPLPVQVVATQLPPVWISYGDQQSVIVDLEGGETPYELGALQDIDPEEVAFIRFFAEQEILKKCEIIDMPGISDPNMARDVWARIMPFADGVLWCSPATQAWRQSEAAVWDEIDERVRQKSILLLTRADMLLNEKDKFKVLKRVRTEAGSLFSDVMLISLILARDAGENEEMWDRSGADEFVSSFLGLVQSIQTSLDEPIEHNANSSESGDAEAVTSDGQDAGQSAPHKPVVVPRRPVRQREAVQEILQTEVSAPDPMSFMPKFS